MAVTPTKQEVTELWMEFKASGSPELRNLLMERYLPIVKYNADRVATKLPDEVDTNDLISAGVFGLMDAIEAFDLDRGVKFETYCAPRIRGAILDELRMMDWVPRLVRSRAHKLQAAHRALEAELGRVPSRAELAERLKLTAVEYDKLLRDATAVSLVSLSRKYTESDSNKDLCEIDVLQDRRGKNPANVIQEKDLKELITRGLNRAERLILVLYYYEEMTMKEIGATLDLSESRVSQMHSAVLQRLKGQLLHRRRDLVR